MWQLSAIQIYVLFTYFNSASCVLIGRQVSTHCANDLACFTVVTATRF